MAVGVDYTSLGAVREEYWRCWAWRDDKGRWHRVDGPAVLADNGLQEWWLHGERHRVDGPAYISATGRQGWFRHGLYHRVDGPAVTHSDGRQEWYVQGRDITTEVRPWMARSGITWPFTPEQLVEFELRWG